MTKRTKIEQTLVGLTQAGMTSKQLRKEIEKTFPKASKREIRLAAFSAMITIAEMHPDHAVRLQDFALGTGARPVGHPHAGGD